MSSYLCFEPITAGFAALGLTASAGYAGYEYIKCKMHECCDNKWVQLNMSGLRRDFDENLFGQHLVQSVVLPSLAGHMSDPNPQKALVLAFHGWTGGGKNHVAKMIVKNLYAEGLKSNYVHQYIATEHFPHKRKVQEYRDQIQKDIKYHTRQCQRSIFIFDEVDKMPEGIIDAITPFADFYKDINGVDFRKNIFLFLSNAGGSNITEVALKFWLDGKLRERITLKDMEPLITKGAFNEDGGLRGSEMIRKHLIAEYVPFLPLMKEHVTKCIHAELRKRRHPVEDEIVERILQSLEYGPDDVGLYSKSGCKRITKKIDLYY